MCSQPEWIQVLLASQENAECSDSASFEYSIYSHTPFYKVFLPGLNKSRISWTDDKLQHPNDIDRIMSSEVGTITSHEAEVTLHVLSAIELRFSNDLIRL